MSVEIYFNQVFENFKDFADSAKSTNHIIKLLSHITNGIANVDDFLKN